MQNYNRLVSAVAFGCLLVASGCTEQITVEMHEPGEYKGAPDPLLEIANTAEQNARLEQRVLAIQTDR